MMNHIDIFGEDHSPGERTHYEALIRKQHRITPYAFLLAEEASPGLHRSPRDIELAIKGNMFSNSPRSFELGLELGIPVVGIDLWDDSVFKNDIKDDKGWAVDVRRSFHLRETNMLSIIKSYRPKGNLAVILGDAHIRTTGNGVVGPASPIWRAYHSDNEVTFYRSKNKEID